jgi:hypothetical protein
LAIGWPLKALSLGKRKLKQYFECDHLQQSSKFALL